jgi:WD40 repeat protein
VGVEPSTRQGPPGEITLWEVGGWGRTAAVKYEGAALTCVTFMPGATTLVSASLDKTIRLWDIAQLQSSKMIEKHAGPAYFAAVSADGRLLASGGGQTPVKILHLKGKTRSHEIPEPNAWSFAFSPDARMLAVTTVSDTAPGHVLLWDALAKKEKAVLKGFSAAVFSVAFSPDGKILASGSGFLDPKAPRDVSGEITLWDANSGKELQRLRAHRDAVMSLAFSPDGKTLASGSSDCTAKIWKLTTATSP